MSRDAQQVHLDLSLQRVARLLELRIADGGLESVPIPRDFDDPDLASIRERLAELEDDASLPPAPLVLLRDRYRLPPAEFDTLVLLVGVEMEERISRQLATLRGGARHGYVDAQIAAGLFGMHAAERRDLLRRLEPDGPLRVGGLVESLAIDGAPPYQAARCLRLRSHVLAMVQGERRLSDELARVARRIMPQVAKEQLPGLEGVVDELREVMSGFARLSVRYCPIAAPEALDFDRGVLIGLGGERGGGRSAVVRAACAEIGRPVIEVDGWLLSGFGDGPDRLADVVIEAELYGEVVHLEGTDAMCAAHPSAAGAICHTLRGRAVCFVASYEGDSLPDGLSQRALIEVSAPRLHLRTQRELMWQTNMTSRVEVGMDVDFRALVDAAPLAGRQIQRAVRLAELYASASRQPNQTASLQQNDLERAARAQRRNTVGALTSEEAPSEWLLDAIVMTDEVRSVVDAIIEAARSRVRALDEWGFSRVIGRGGGLICLFDGPPGTGKTITSEAIAKTLGLELHRINVGRIVDKYIGETEKNLESLFSSIVPERTVLLFDEADSLFGSRVSVNSSTDRYANMAINTLLQLVERYTGVVILTTNLKEAIDSAFERRITYKVTFERPEPKAREELWRLHLPPDAPLSDDIDLKTLAHDVELSGGNIKNVVFRAALECAAGGVIHHEALYEQAVKEAGAAGLLVRRRGAHH